MCLTICKFTLYNSTETTFIFHTASSTLLSEKSENCGSVTLGGIHESPFLHREEVE